MNELIKVKCKNKQKTGRIANRHLRKLNKVQDNHLQLHIKKRSKTNRTV